MKLSTRSVYFAGTSACPPTWETQAWGRTPGPDYGMFDFANLFSKTLNNQSLDQLSPDAKGEFLARFEHKVSDHMPIWLDACGAWTLCPSGDTDQ